MKRVKFTLFAALCCMSLIAFAEAGPICRAELKCEQSGCSDPVVYVTWNTAANGDVNITIDKDEKTAWRGRGMASEVSKTKGWTLIINDEEVDIADYFEKDYTESKNQSSAPVVYTLRLKEGKSVPEGSIIKLTPKDNICWWTGIDGNGWGKKTFEYLYGANCETLSAPVITSIDASGAITITSNATDVTFDVNIYLGGVLYAVCKDIHSGDVLPFNAVATADYTVGAVAKTAEAVSEESAPYTWHIDAVAPVIGVSEICGEEFVSDTYSEGPTNLDDSKIALSFNTVKGNIVVSIKAVTEGNVALFRNNDALGIGYFYINGAPAAGFFTTDSKGDQDTYVLTLCEGLSLPVGTVITYQGTLQWKTTNFSNGYRRNTWLSYTYGTVCDGTSTLLPAVAEQPAARKQLMNGQLVIIVGEQVYDATGKIIR